MHKIIRSNIIFLILLSFVWGNSLLAQYSTINFKHYNVESGLSQNNVNCIIKDEKGFMWFGTDDGLNRFDGYTFTTFNRILKDSSSISSNHIIDILEDSRGRLWIGTWNGGLNMYDRNNNSFTRYMHDNNDTTSLIGNDIEFIHEDSNGTLWVGAQGAGLSRMIWDDQGKASFVNYPHYKDSNSLSLNALTVIHEDSKNNLWIGTRGGGIYILTQKEDGKYSISTYFNKSENNKGRIDNFITSIYEDKAGVIWVGTENGLSSINLNGRDSASIVKYTHNTNNPKSLSSNYITSIFEDSENNLWIGTLNNGLNLFDKENRTFTNYPLNEHDKNRKSGSPIITILEDGDGTLWVGTPGNGLSQLNRTNNTFINHRHSENNNSSLSDNIINCIYEDNYGIIWIGTRNGGISVFNKSISAFKHFKNDPYNSSSLSNNVVLSFCENKEGNIWIGTDGGGIDLFNKENHSFTRYGSLSPINILSIYRDKQDNIWFGSWAGGLHLFNKTYDSISSYLFNNNDTTSISSPNAWVIYEDSKGSFWVGTCCNGLNLFNPAKGTFSYFTYDENDSTSISGLCIWSIFEDSKGNLWIGTQAGLSKLVRAENGNHTFINYKHSENNKYSISNDWIWSIFEDSDSNLWVGTNGGGLNFFDSENETFTAYTEDDGLPNNVIYGILEDNHKNLWMSTNYGLSRFDTKTKSFKNFDTGNGLQNNQFKSSAYLKSSNGEMYFGGVYGFYVFHPDSIKGNQQIPPIRITDFKLFNKPVEIGGEDSPLKKHISETKEIILSYKQSSISLEFVALNYISPEKNEYAYMLEGFDPSWNYVGSKRDVSYTNLDPGEYTFKVKGSNNDQVWNEEGASIDIIITPPFWATWWFRAMIFILGISGLYIAYYLRVRYIQEQRKLLTKLVSERTYELNEANAELEEINEEVMVQKEEIHAQNEELIKHREYLEDMVQERTNELVKAKEKAEESDRLKTAFLANMSHEIRTPLNAIAGFSSLITDSGISDQEKDEFKGQIVTNTDSLCILVDDILDLSLIESNQLKIENEVFNVNEFVKEVYSLFLLGREKENLEIKLNNRVVDLDISINSDKNRIKQILVNFLNNAFKFTEEGFIELGLKKENNNIVFYVKDSGVGISEENLEVIFDRFRKIEDDENTLYRGVGLGLAISKSLADLLGGNLWVDSELGKGSVFYLSIPQIITNNVKTDSKGSLETQTFNWESKKILIAEDEYSNYLYVKRAIQNTGVRMTQAKTGMEAVELFQEGNQFDLVIMDLKMPIMNGYNATIKIKELNPNQKVIALSAYPKAKEDQEFLNAGFNDFVAKPIDRSVLLKVVSRYM